MFNQGNSKKRGDVGLGAAIAFFVKNNYTVSLPLTDSQDYDLIVDKDNVLYRVQVKTVSHKVGEIYAVSLSVRGGNRSGKGKIKKFDKSKVELLFVLTEDNDQYLMPSKDIDSTAQINLGNKYNQYKI